MDGEEMEVEVIVYIDFFPTSLSLQTSNGGRTRARTAGGHEVLPLHASTTSSHVGRGRGGQLPALAAAAAALGSLNGRRRARSSARSRRSAGVLLLLLVLHLGLGKHPAVDLFPKYHSGMILSLHRLINSVLPAADAAHASSDGDNQLRAHAQENDRRMITCCQMRL